MCRHELDRALNEGVTCSLTEVAVSEFGIERSAFSACIRNAASLTCLKLQMLTSSQPLFRVSLLHSSRSYKENSRNLECTDCCHDTTKPPNHRASRQRQQHLSTRLSIKETETNRQSQDADHVRLHTHHITSSRHQHTPQAIAKESAECSSSISVELAGCNQRRHSFRSAAARSVASRGAGWLRWQREAEGEECEGGVYGVWTGSC